MPLLLGLLFVGTQLLEIWLLIQVGHAIGGWQTLVLLVVDSLLGAVLLRREGRRTWRAFRAALQEHRMPAREVADGALVLVGGTLLLTPGFLTDVVGLLCLLPPSRAVLRRLLSGAVARRLGVVGKAARDGSPGHRPTGRPDVIDGEVVQTHEGPPPSGKRP